MAGIQCLVEAPDIFIEGGRILIGSWYGTSEGSVDLGGTTTLSVAPTRGEPPGRAFSAATARS